MPGDGNIHCTTCGYDNELCRCGFVDQVRPASPLPTQGLRLTIDQQVRAGFAAMDRHLTELGVGPHPSDESLSFLLTSLLHVADAYGHDFDRRLRQARTAFEEDKKPRA